MGIRFKRFSTIVLFFGVLCCYCSAYEDAESVFNYCQNKCKPRTTSSSSYSYSCSSNGGESQQRIFECMNEELDKYPPDQRQDVQSQWTKSPRYKHAVQNCRKRKQPDLPCDPDSPYRTYDGSCNNLQHPTWGKTGDCVQRLCEDKSNGTRMRRSCDGTPLARPREISDKMCSGQPENSSVWTMIFPMFAQFISHDISNSAPSPGTSPECCPVCKGKKYADCYPFKVAKNDSFYGEYDVKCMSVVKSPSCGQCSMGKSKKQPNTVTAAIDASPVYGSCAETAAKLRAWDGTGKLKTDDGNLLPPNDNPNEPFCPKGETSKCFMAGDDRCNQHSGIMSMQTLFMREHNKVAEKLADLNPHWDDERLYQESRRIVIAKVSCIAYRELLLILIGPEGQAKYNIFVRVDGQGTKYDPSVRLGAYAEFSTGAYRLHNVVGHNTGYDKAPWFRDTFSNWRLLRDGKMSQLLDGMQHTPSASFAIEVIIDLHGQLFAPPGKKYGEDLISTDIGRGREQKIVVYVKIVELCTGEKITTFEQLITRISQENINKLKELYKCVEDIDAWVGIMVERIQLPSFMGPTASCVIGMQFKNLHDGDRYYWEHEGEKGSFTKDQREALKYTYMARILCDHTDIGWVRPLVLFRHNPYMPCAAIPKVDYSAWKE